MAASGGSDGAPKGRDLPQPSRSRSSINSTLGTKLENAKRISIEQLEVITDNFSPERVIGRGGYGTIYKGVNSNGKCVAVKVLHKNTTGTDNGEFKHEFESLMRLKHHNIIKLVGFCYETRHKPMLHDGETIFAEDIYKALCFEYMQNGNLKEHISVECDGLEWHTRYKIIKGTCEGLKYLHEEFKEPIYHLDLKPENILLDENMVPKLADFGSSKLFGKELTMVISQNLSATIGYVPPEYYSHQVVSKKFDIFSLGVVIIKIIAGPRGNSLSAEMEYQDFLDQVHENWRKRFQEKWHNSKLLQAYCQQVNICIIIALSCMDYDRFKRPGILDIIKQLNKTETVIKELHQDHRWTRISDANRTPAIDSQKQSLALEEVRFLINNLTLENNRSCEPSVSPRKKFHPNILDLPSDQRTSYRGRKSTEILFPTRLPNSPPSSRGKHCPTSHVHSRAFGQCPGSPTAWQDDARSLGSLHPLPLPLPPGFPCTSSRSLHSQWKKGKLLGSGTFGQVYLGLNSEGDQMCAIREVKVIADDSELKECLRKLNQEMCILNQLSHPNIVQYYGSELSSETFSLYLEFVNGGSIHKLLREYGPFEEAVLRNYTAQILSGLAYLHRRNIVHRDIKGSNIFVNRNGDIRLADFSMTNHISEATSIKSFKGSPYWMAPEVIMNTNGDSLSVDIWSLGCTIIEMATTRPPWNQYEGVAAIFKIANSKDIPDMPDHLSSEAKSFLKLCLQRDPAARPTAAQLIVHPWVKDQASVTKSPVK